jgi:plant cysteine oxidase
MPVHLGGGGGKPTPRVGARASSAARKSRRQKKKPAPMQGLFDTSREVFAASSPGFVPPPDAVARLSALLSTL